MRCRQAYAVTCAQSGHRRYSNGRSLQQSSLKLLPHQQVFYHSTKQSHTNKVHRCSLSVSCGAMPQMLSIPSWSLPGNSQVSWSGMFQIGTRQNGHSQCTTCRSKRLHDGTAGSGGKLFLLMCKQKLCTKHADDLFFPLLHDMHFMSEFFINVRRQVSKQCCLCSRCCTACVAGIERSETLHHAAREDYH